MKLQQKALLNLIRFNALEDPNFSCKAWQKEDLRRVFLKEILERLEAFKIYMDKKRFIFLSMDFSSPEAFAQKMILSQHTDEQSEQIYLLIFELWRRLRSDKQTISIFCDELDRRIFLYDKGQLKDDEMIQNALANLEEILDENVDLGGQPEKLFDSVSLHCAHDLEGFLYDYIYEQIEANNRVYAAELIEGFYPYIKDVKWFDFLKMKILADSNVYEVNEIIRNILIDIDKSKDLGFHLTLLRFMVKMGDRSLFIRLVEKTLPLIEKNQDFQILLIIVVHFYRCIDQEDIEKKIQGLLAKYSNRKKEAILNKNSKDFKLFASFFISAC